MTDCACDSQIPVDDSGACTVVVSSIADRPANATLADDVLWLDRGSTAQDMVMILRHMLPDPGFDQNVLSVPRGASARTMAQYAPRATSCLKADFESAGASACGL